MSKFKIYKIKNGPKLILAEDRKKNQTKVEIDVNFGGLTTGYIINNKKYNVLPGTAHLLEHTLLEDTIYGIFTNYIRSDYAKINGATGPVNTIYSLNVVRNFNKHLLELLDITNKPLFSADKLSKIKQPVEEEAKRDLDITLKNNRDKYNEIKYGKGKYIEAIGTKESLKKINIDHLKEAHKVFYQPTNQTISIFGNFNIKETINLIEDYYKTLNKEGIEYKEIYIKPKKKTKNDIYICIDNQHDESTELIHMCKLNKLKPIEMKKYQYYLDYFIDTLFDDSSEAFKTLINDKLSLYSFETYYNIRNKEITVGIKAYTSNHGRTEELINNVLNNTKFNKKAFELNKRKSIADFLANKDNFWEYAYSWHNNINRFNYKKTDSLGFLETLNFNEYKEFINRLDFSNYFILRQVKEEK